MKLIDVLNERRQVPVKHKVEIGILKEYIFKDWQIFNEKLVPAFKILRNKALNENYSSIGAKNRLSNVIDFACKKYMAEHTIRKYAWNEIFSKRDRTQLVYEIVNFFERYNLNSEYGILNEQNDASIPAKITFSELELEQIEGSPVRLAINFNYDEETTNHIINVIGNGNGVTISPSDLELIQNLVKVNLENASSGQKMSYLKLYVNGSNISRTDLKRLTSGAFLNREVTLTSAPVEAEPTDGDVDDYEGIDNTDNYEETPSEPTQAPVEEPVGQPRRQQPKISDNEIREAVYISIRNFLGE